MDELLKTIPYWDDLTAEEQEQVSKQAVVLHFKKGDILYGPDVECVGQIHLLKGQTRAYILSDEGREVTLFRVEEGDNCILSASCVLAQISFEAHMKVSEPSDILIIPVRLFGDFCDRNINVRCFAYELATRRFSTVVSVMEQTLFARLDKRLAAILLRMYAETGSREIRITQEQLALRINSVRETVGRTLKRFSEDGMIEIQRGLILLRDMRKLESTAK